MALEVVPIKDANNATVNITVDDDGFGNKTQVQAAAYGADGSAKTLVSTANPLPVQEPAFSAIIGQGTISVATTSTVLRVYDAARKFLIVSNGGTTNVWVHFGAVAAVLNSGVLLPPGAKDIYYTNMEVRSISATSANVVGYVAV